MRNYWLPTLSHYLQHGMPNSLPTFERLSFSTPQESVSKVHIVTSSPQNNIQVFLWCGPLNNIPYLPGPLPSRSMDQSDQSQHKGRNRYYEGLEPVIYHEGAFLQAVGTGMLQVEDHGVEIVPSENPHEVQYPQVLFGEEAKEVCRSNTSPPGTDGILSSNSHSRRRSKRRWWWMAAVITAIVIAGMIAGIVEGLQHKRKR